MSQQETYILKQLHNDGITIIQVTHSEKNAQYGDRIIQLEDGHVREDISINVISITIFSQNNINHRFKVEEKSIILNPTSIIL